MKLIKSLLLGLLIIVALLVTLNFFVDDFIGWFVEKKLTALLETPVEIDEVALNIFKKAMVLQNIQITDPSNSNKNIFQADKAIIQFQILPVFKNHLIIDLIKLTNLKIGTAKKTTPKKDIVHSPSSKWQAMAYEHLMQQIYEAPDLEFDHNMANIRIDSLLKSVHLSSLEFLQKLEHKVDSTFKAIAPHKSSSYDSHNNTVLKKHMANLFQELQELDKLIEDDYQILLKHAKLTDFTPENVGIMLFGHTMTVATIDLLKFISKVRSLFPVETSWLEFKSTTQQVKKKFSFLKPKILIKQIQMQDFRGKNLQNDVYVRGQINDVCNYPREYGKPITFEIEIIYPEPAKTYYFTGVIDHTALIPQERFQLFSSGNKLVHFRLPKRRYIPVEIEAERGKLGAKFKLTGEHLQFRIYFHAQPAKFVFADTLVAHDRLGRICRKVFEDLDWLKVIADVRGNIPELSIEVVSNVNELLSDKLKNILDADIQKARHRLHSKLLKLIDQRKEALLKKINAYNRASLPQKSANALLHTSDD